MNTLPHHAHENNPLSWPFGHIESLLSRYASKVTFHPSGCWEWIGYKDEKGYGRASLSKYKTGFAHRVFWQAFRGPIPDGLTLDHLCRNHACVNPAHLEPVTIGENARRGQGPKMLAHHNNTCVQGHVMDEANTYVSPQGQRHCRKCRTLREMRRKARRTTHA